jgi:hypothetical protein
MIVMNKPLSAFDKKNENQEAKEPAEKERMRRYLRERDLKKHLKGKLSIEGDDNEDFKSTVPLKENKNMTELEKDLEKDAQLRQAVSLLSVWDIMVSTFKNHQFEKIPSTLPLAKINR